MRIMHRGFFCSFNIRPISWVILAVFVCCFVLLTRAAHGIEVGRVPDAGALMRGTEQLQQYYTPGPPLPAAPERQMRPKEGQQVFVVKRFRVLGATLVSSKEIQDALKPWVDREITFADLEDALQALADLYQKHGWYARPQLPEQDLVDGVVTIQIIESKLGQIQVDETAGARISSVFVTNSLTARQRIGEPLNLNDMERAILILNDTPGIQVSTSMGAGTEFGSTDLITKVEPKRWWGLSASADNFGSKSTGYGRLALNGNADNPFGIGDQFTANYIGSLGTQFGRIGYTLPVGYDGLRLGVNYSALNYFTTGDYGYPVQQYGTARTSGLSATYPIIRSAIGNVNASLMLDNKRYNNASKNVSDEPLANLNAPNAQPGVVVPISDKHITVTNLMFSGDRFDGFAGGGGTYWSAGANLGYVNLSASPKVAIDVDQIGPNTAGQYSKFTASASRLQRLTASTTLWMSWQGQLASKNLDSSEDFSLGGPQGVRAYPNYEAQGDQGWLGTIELRHALADQWQVSAFFDAGRIMVNRNTWRNSFSPNLYNLYGAGVGVTYTLPGRLSARAMLARQVGSNPGANPINGTNSDGSTQAWRLWVSLSGAF